MEFVDPIVRLRTQAANLIKTERAELFQAYKDAVAPDVHLTEMQRQELEDRMGGLITNGSNKMARVLKHCSHALYPQSQPTK